MHIARLCFIFLFLSLYLPVALALGGVVYGDRVLKEVADVEAGVEIVTDKLNDMGYEVGPIINHAAAADSVGLKLRPTQVIFARPPKRIERRLLRRSPTTGIDLPLKFLVFEDEAGDVHLIFNSPGYLLDRHALRTADPVLRRLSRGLDQLGEVDSGLVTVQSAQTLDETVERLLTALKDNGFRVPLVLDFNEQNSYYHGYGHSHLPTLIVFGNPNAGTPLMQESQSVALDLPQKFLVWKDRYGDVSITYNDPAFLANRHGIVGQDGRIGNIQKALAGLVAEEDSPTP